MSCGVHLLTFNIQNCKSACYDLQMHLFNYSLAWWCKCYCICTLSHSYIRTVLYTYFLLSSAHQVKCCTEVLGFAFLLTTGLLLLLHYYCLSNHKAEPQWLHSLALVGSNYTLLLLLVRSQSWASVTAQPCSCWKQLHINYYYYPMVKVGMKKWWSSVTRRNAA